MTLADLLIQNVAAAPANPSTAQAAVTGSSSNSGQRFDKFLSRAEQNTPQRDNTPARSNAEPNRADSQRADNRTERRPDNRQPDNGRSPVKRDASDPAQPTENDAPANTQAVQPTQPTQPVTDQQTDTQATETVCAAAPVNVITDVVAKDTDDEEDILVGIADMFGIAVEDLRQILNKLQISAGDLAQPENAALLVQKLFGTETAGGLLAADGAKEVLAAIKAYFTQIAQPITPEIQQMVQELVEAQAVKPLETMVQEFGTTLDETIDAATKTAAAKVTVEYGEATSRTPAELYTQAASETAAAAQKVEAQSQQFEFNQGMAGNNQAEAGTTQKVTVEIDTQSQGNLFTAARQTAEAQAAAPVRQAPVSTAEIINQIVDRMKIGVRPEISEIRISLKPEHLGDVSVRITTREGVVAAQIVAGTEQVRNLLESGVGRLREALEEQGIKIDEIDVSVGQNLYSNGGMQRNALGGNGYNSANAVTDSTEAEEPDALPELIIEPDSTVSYTA
jgi:flagellar hook-length control protein FliK